MKARTVVGGRRRACYICDPRSELKLSRKGGSWRRSRAKQTDGMVQKKEKGEGANPIFMTAFV